VGAPELLVILVVAFFFLVVPIAAAIDAGSRPEWAFENVGTSKTLWVALPLIGALLCGIVGLIAGIMWFASYRAQVIAAQQRGVGA
jgi:hypothetical protein